MLNYIGEVERIQSQVQSMAFILHCKDRGILSSSNVSCGFNGQ